MTAEFVLDAGAFIAYERNDEVVRNIVRTAEAGHASIRTSSAVVAQVWRGGPRQARLARLLSGGLVDERALDPAMARRIGLLAAVTGASDVVDGHVAELIRAVPGSRVLTSDAGDLARWGVARDAIIEC